MAVRAAIDYIGTMILRELGIATYVPADVAAASASMRVLDVSMFDPNGGQLMVYDNDNLITYTGLSGDSLTGIPTSSTGSISATIKGVADSARDLLYRVDMLSAYELERMLDLRRRWIEGETLKRDATRKQFLASAGWFDTGVQLRDSNTDTYDVVIPDTVSYERGEFSFNTARDSSETLYVFGYRYNYFAVLGDIIETIAADDRWNSYSQVGQMAKAHVNAHELANFYRAKGRYL